MDLKLIRQAFADLLFFVDDDVSAGELQFPMENVIPRSCDDMSLRRERPNLLDDAPDRGWVRHGNDDNTCSWDTDLFEHFRFAGVADVGVEPELPSGADRA